MEMLTLPLANERRPCVLVGRDNMALPASLISQIGYRCHPSLYTEGDPGEKVELVAGRLGTAVLDVKHKSYTEIKMWKVKMVDFLMIKLPMCHGNRTVSKVIQLCGIVRLKR